MRMLNQFDLGSDLTQFFLGAFLLVMIFVVLLTIVSPRKAKRRKGEKRVDDRLVSTDGELID